MTTYSAIANSEIAVGAPITNSLMTKVRDNPLAIQEDDASAPNVAYATSAGTITSQGALATLAEVAQGELKSTTGIVSTTSGSFVNLTLAGGEYGFYPQLRSSGGGAAVLSQIAASGVSSVSYITNISLLHNAAGTAYAQQRYIQASPPYDLGDGEIGRFIFAVIDNTTKKIESVYQAADAPWHYNGKTNTSGRLGKDGKKYRIRRDTSTVPHTFNLIKGDPVKMAEYISAFNAAPLTNELITQELCQRDMNDIPHPFLGNNLTGKTVVMLDPVSDLSHELNCMCNEHNEFDLNALLHDGYLKISSTGLKRFGPPGILIPSFKWKTTK